MKKVGYSFRCLVAIAPIVLLTACGDGAEVDEAEVAEPGMMTEESAADMPRVEITQPADGATVTGPEVQVRLATYGAVVEAADGRQTAGRGHHHIFIDEDVTSSTEPIPPTTETIIHMGNGAEEYTIPNLAPGPHRLIAVFAYGDHVANPEVAQDTVEFTVAAP